MTKSALIAVDPVADTNRSFERFSAIVRLFQEHNLLGPTSVLSLVHPGLYASPLRLFRENKHHLKKEAKEKIAHKCKDAFQAKDFHVLSADSHSNEVLVAKAARYGKLKGHDLLVLASSDKSGLPAWLLGSFSATAALTATLSPLIIKPHLVRSDLATHARFTVAVDTIDPWSADALKWLQDFARSAKAHVDLVYVEPKFRPGIDALQWRTSKSEARKILDGMRTKLAAAGVKASAAILEETQSKAHALVEYADEHKAWATIVKRADRSVGHKLLLGSTSRKTLALTKRPFLCIVV